MAFRCRYHEDTNNSLKNKTISEDNNELNIYNLCIFHCFVNFSLNAILVPEQKNFLYLIKHTRILIVLN